MTDALERLARLNRALDVKYAAHNLVGPVIEQVGWDDVSPEEMGFAILTPHPNGRDWCYSAINHQLAEEMNGLPVANHIGRSVRSMYPDLAGTAYPMFEQLRAGERDSIEFQFEAVTAAGLGSWLGTYAALRSEDGFFLNVHALVRKAW